jgi:hypothetical protein
MRISLRSVASNQDEVLRDDLKRIQDAHNIGQQYLELDSYTADPSGFETTTGKIYAWHRSDLQEIRYRYNGTTYKIAATAA